MSDRKTENSSPSREQSGFGKTGFETPEGAAFRAAILQRLKTPPEVEVPLSFAARVAHLAVSQPLPPRSVWSGFGPRIALGSGLLLLVALFVFAAHATPSFSSLRFDLELLLLAELAGVGLLVPHFGSRE